MKTKILAIGVCALAALFISSCTKSVPTGGGTTPKTSTIFGWVERSDDLSRVPNVIVYDPSGMASPDTTLSDGSFRLTYQLTDTYSGSLIATRNTFTNDTVGFSLDPGAHDTLTQFLVLKADSTSQVTAAGTGVAASLVLVSNNTDNIAVRGTGADESVALTFEARDSLGIPVLTKTQVFFSILGGPGGSEYLFPTSAFTNLSGQVTTRLTSGTKAGVVQIYAFARPDTSNPALIVSCRPVRITISGGLADTSHVTMWSDKVNYPVMVSPGKQIGTISIQLGDQFSNPPQPTSVYFTSNGGLITATSTTSSTGLATASLFGGAPYPPGGIDTITAYTQGNQSIKKSLIVTASGAPIISAPNSIANISSGGYGDLYFDIKDVNGNPISGGNAVSVTLSGPGGTQLTLSGDNTFTTFDTRDTSTVHYHVKLDNSSGGTSGGTFTATIAVLGPNGSVSKNVTGFLQAKGQISGGGGGTGYTSSIKLATVSATDISVQGTGNSETATLVFQAIDSTGASVDQAHGGMMHFTLSAPTLGATLTIDSIQTDPSGLATTLVRAGTISGVLQVRASLTIPSGETKRSDPVRLSINSGLPDQAHFTMGAPTYNFPGLDYNGQTLPISVQMGDKYSNPASPTTVYFSSTHGIIQTVSTVSDVNGFVTKTLYSGNPRPVGADSLSEGAGWTKVYANTFGDNGAPVKDSLYILWTGAPVITKTSGAATYTLAPNASAGPWTFRVTDRLGHPLSKGTNISVSGNGIIITGQSSATLPDALSGGSGITDFTITIQNSNAGPAALTAPVSGILMVTVSHPLYGTYTFPLATGVAN